MDANESLERLLQVSEDIRAAVIFELGGQPLAATLLDEDAGELAALGDAMLAYAGTLRETAVRGLEALTPEGGVFLVRDGERAVVAIAAPGALVGLVQHDLRALLGSLSKPRRKTRAKASAVS